MRVTMGESADVALPGWPAIGGGAPGASAEKVPPVEEFDCEIWRNELELAEWADGCEGEDEDEMECGPNE